MRPSKKSSAVMLLTLFSVLALLLAACGGSTTTVTGTTPTATSSGKPAPAPASGQVFKWAFRLPDIATFDPGQVQDATSIDAINLVFTGLVQLDDNLKVQPQLATSYDASDNGLTYTFHLKTGLKFSDGTKLDANDVAYSIDRALSPTIFNLSGVSLTYLGLIKGAADRTAGKGPSTLIGSSIIVQDANTLILKLSQATAYFLQALSYPTAYVVEKSVIDKWGLKWTDHLGDNGGQGGDGPFMVKSYDHAKGIVFVPNPNYYGKKPQLQEIDYVSFKGGRQSAYEAYQAGQVDMSDVPLANYDQVKSSPEFSLNPELRIGYIGLNYNVKPLDNIHIRQALSLALNRDAIIKAAWRGAYTPTCHIVPQGMYGYAPNLTCVNGTSTKGDATKAKAAFQQGLTEEGLTVATFPNIKYTYPANSQETANEVTTEIQIWKNVLGITITPSVMDQNAMYTAESQTYQHTGPLTMWYAGWGADYPDPQDWITLQFGDNQPYNEFNFGINSGTDNANQMTLQKQMDAADVMTDPTARAAAYNTIEQTLVNDVAWLSIYQRPGFRMTKSYVIGLTHNAFAEHAPDSWANVYIAQH